MSVDKILSEDPFKNVVTLHNTRNGSTIYLLGTCHVSEESARIAQLLVEKVCPDLLFLELSHERRHVLFYELQKTKQKISYPPLPKDQDILTKITHYLLLIISTLYVELEGILEQSAGGEFRGAFAVARSQGTKVCLGDRDSRVTMQRLAAHYLQPSNFLFFLYNSIVKDEKPEKLSKALQEIVREIVFHPPKVECWSDFIDALRNDERIKIFLEKVIDYCLEDDLDVSSVPPPMLSERDEYMASWLRDCYEDTIVAIVGKAHIPGISTHLNDHHVAGSALRVEMSQPVQISKPILLAQWLCIVTSSAYVYHKCIYQLFRPRYTNFPKSIYFRVFFPVFSIGFVYDVNKFMQTRIPCPHSEPLLSPFSQFLVYPSAFSDLQYSLSTKLLGFSMGAYMAYACYYLMFQPRYTNFPKSMYSRFLIPAVSVGFLYESAKFTQAWISCPQSERLSLPLSQCVLDRSVNKFNDLQSSTKIVGLSMGLGIGLGFQRALIYVWQRGVLHYGPRRGALHYGNQLLRFIKFR